MPEDCYVRGADSTREQAVGADLWTLFQQPDERREATMQAAQVMVAAKQVRPDRYSARSKRAAALCMGAAARCGH